MSNINKIRLSGTTYDIEDPNAAKTVELTQAEYDALTVKDPNTFYVITDAQAADLSDYYTKDEVDDEITAATSGKQDTLVSGTNIKTVNNESLLGEGTRLLFMVILLHFFRRDGLFFINTNILQHGFEHHR